MPTYKDNNGQWYCKFYYTDWKGVSRQKMKRGFTRQKDAKLWESAFISKERFDEKTTYGAISDIYIEENNPRWRYSTFKTYDGALRLYILAYFGDIPICEITERHIVEWQNTMLTRGLSDIYIHKIDTVFRTVFKFGAKRCAVRDIPFIGLDKIGKGNVRSLQFWTHEEYNRFIEFVDTEDRRLAFQLLFFAGLRLGELMALTVGDISLNKKILTVNRSLQRIKKKDVITEPKTQAGIRKISLPNFLCVELAEYFKKLYDCNDNTRLFMFSKQSLNYPMKIAANKAGLTKIRIHDLRHSHVAMLIEKGVDVLVIAERLGHTNVNITLGTYGHLYPNKQGQIADLLDVENNSIKTVS